MAPDGDVCVGEVNHCGCELLDRLLSLRAEGRTVGVEEDTVIEGDADSLETVDFKSLDLGVESCEFSGFLVHLLADDSSGSSTYCSACGCTYRCGLKVSANEISEGCAGDCAAACSKQSAFTGLVHGRATGEEDCSAKCKCKNLFHNY